LFLRVRVRVRVRVVAVVVNQDSVVVYILDDDEGKYQNNGKTWL